MTSLLPAARSADPRKRHERQMSPSPELAAPTVADGWPA
jgi:hypothetical protein